MRLELRTPFEVLVDEEIAKVLVEAREGSTCLLPRHGDFVAALVPGILQYVRADGSEVSLAVDHGIAVKRGALVQVATLRAVTGPELGTLREALLRRGESTRTREQETRLALARLESGFLRQVHELVELEGD